MICPKCQGTGWCLVKRPDLVMESGIVLDIARGSERRPCEHPDCRAGDVPGVKDVLEGAAA